MCLFPQHLRQELLLIWKQTIKSFPQERFPLLGNKSYHQLIETMPFYQERLNSKPQILDHLPLNLFPGFHYT